MLASVANDLAILERETGTAVALAERAVALNPGSANVWFNSGAVRLWAGDPGVAIEHLETATRLDPTGPSRPARMLYIAMARFFQRRFGEAVALLKERVQLSESPGCYAFLSASYGHLGDTSAALAALARYRALTTLPIDSLARSLGLAPTRLKLLLDGIVLAEGTSPAGG